ncbi:hypothetical protein EMCRGX_G026534 [Ephydatia muelleri]
MRDNASGVTQSNHWHPIKGSFVVSLAIVTCVFFTQKDCTDLLKWLAVAVRILPQHNRHLFNKLSQERRHGFRGY